MEVAAARVTTIAAEVAKSAAPSSLRASHSPSRSWPSPSILSVYIEPILTMSDVVFKIRGRKEPLVFGPALTGELDIAIFWADLSAKAGATGPWREQTFCVSCPGHADATIISGEHLFLLAMQERELPPHKEQSTRASSKLPGKPWFIKAKPAFSNKQASEAEASGTTAGASGNMEPAITQQLPFGIFVREELRAVVRDLPDEFKQMEGIDSILITSFPGGKTKWTPDDCALNQRQADALGLVGSKVRSTSSSCARAVQVERHATGTFEQL